MDWIKTKYHLWYEIKKKYHQNWEIYNNVGGLVDYFWDFIKGDTWYERVIEAIPSEFFQDYQVAIELRKAGKYYESANIFIDYILKSGKLNPMILLELYKAIACSGRLSITMITLYNTKMIFDSLNPLLQLTSTSGPKSIIDEHVIKLKEAIKGGKEKVVEYLKNLSGNPNYKFLPEYRHEVANLIGQGEHRKFLLLEIE